jgi:hypothetical protein
LYLLEIALQYNGADNPQATTAEGLGRLRRIYPPIIVAGTRTRAGPVPPFNPAIVKDVGGSLTDRHSFSDGGWRKTMGIESYSTTKNGFFVFSLDAPFNG